MMIFSKREIRSVVRLWFGSITLITLVAVWGCNSSAPKSVEINRVEHLDAILRAYQSALEKLQRPPKDMEELSPFLANVGDPKKLLASPVDQKPYIILWGVDPRQITMTDPANPQPPLVAFESQAVNGQRYVATGFGVTPMPEEQFQHVFGSSLPKDSSK